MLTCLIHSQDLSPAPIIWKTSSRASCIWQDTAAGHVSCRILCHSQHLAPAPQPWYMNINLLHASQCQISLHHIVPPLSLGQWKKWLHSGDTRKHCQRWDPKFDFCIPANVSSRGTTPHTGWHASWQLAGLAELLQLCMANDSLHPNLNVITLTSWPSWAEGALGIMPVARGFPYKQGPVWG